MSRGFRGEVKSQGLAGQRDLRGNKKPQNKETGLIFAKRRVTDKGKNVVKNGVTRER